MLVMTACLEKARVNKDAEVTLDASALSAREAEDIAAILVGIEPWSRMDYNKQELAKRIGTASDTDRSLSILARGRRVGLMRIREPWLLGPLISIFAVFPEYQGQGIGRRALVAFEHNGPEDWRNIWLTVSTFNQSALAFYRRCGFAQVGLLEGLVGDGWDEILMRKLHAIRCQNGDRT